MGDFVDRHLSVRIVLIVLISWALAYGLTWFPYGFITADLTMDPFKWSDIRRGVMVFLFIAELCFVGAVALN